jgi:hypothetical protein
MVRIASGESQVIIWASSGWEVRTFLVLFAYAAKAVSKMNRKREDESIVEGI